jgi:NitT/TauT family transport system ATP-binding protein
MRRDGGQLEVLRDINLEVAPRSIVALVGASGSGKSTLLNIIAGLIAPDSGAVFLNDVRSSEFKDWRSMTYMFQEDRLFPWRTTAQNIGLGLEAANISRTERRDRVQHVLELTGLESFADAYPHELSGGMRSRAALGRSLVTEPTILLMDEPFSKLDPSIRGQMHEEVLRIAELKKMTVLFVTHDVEEAVVLADKIVVLEPRPGRVRETRPIALSYPRNPLSPDVSEQVRLLRLSLS